MTDIRTFFAFDRDDTVERRQEKLAAFIVAFSCCVAGAAWTVMYLQVFGWGVAAALPLGFVGIVGTALVIAHVRRNHLIAVFAEIVCIIGVTTAIQWSIGGVFDSGFVMVWAVLGPITALMFLSARWAILWFGVFLALLVATIMLDNVFSAAGLPVVYSTRLVFAALNLGVLSAVMFLFAGYFVRSALVERARANRLLLNVLPSPIAARLKAGEETIAEHYESASVLFADLVGSTPLFAELDPAETVGWLNEIFSAFDAHVERHGVEKIRTVGDNYMVVAGAPVFRDDHAEAVARLAIDMIETVSNAPARHGRRVDFRIGINSGPLVAGVIGTTKFHYDVWGDAVNIAARMESQGVAGKIQITAATKDLLGDGFRCTRRGEVEVRGRGTTETWFLEGPA